jgi:hypothetical protein
MDRRTADIHPGNDAQDSYLFDISALIHFQ